MPAKPKTPRKSVVMRDVGVSKKQHPMMAELYRKAEARVKEQSRHQPAATADQKSATDSRRLLHELQVHQVELEMQNAELQEGRNRMELLLEKYTDLYDLAPVGYFSLNELGMIVEANLTSATMLGVDRSKLINQRLLALMAAPSRPVFLVFLEKLFAGTRSQVCEAQLAKAGGGDFWVSLRATSATALGDERKLCRVAFQDISDRRNAEIATREGEKRFRALFDLVPTAVYACDANGVILNFNRRAAELWRRKPSAGDTNERFCGSFKLFQPGGQPVPHAECLMAAVLNGQKAEVLDEEVVIERPDGSRITVVVNIRPLKNEHGEISGAINCFYDITERKQAEEALRRVEVLAASNRKLENEVIQRRAVEASLKQSESHQRQLLEQSRRMQEHLRSLSRQVMQAQEDERKEISRELHDVIGQTLTGINIRLAALKKEAGLNIKGFDRNITRTQKLVEKSVEIVHQFARELRPAVLDDLGLIPALHSFMNSFKARTGIHIVFNAFAAVEELEMPKRTALFRVAQEALTNVSRHAKASVVEVSLEKTPAGVHMKIKDDGKSFNVESALPANGGKRLGLLGMQERLEMVGGTFGIASAPGQGTTVTAQIPFGKPLRTKI